MDGDVLAKQLGELGRQLDDATVELARLDILATAAAVDATNAKETYEDCLADAFLAATGSVDVRKASARLSCKSRRIDAHNATTTWEYAKADVRNQQAMVRAINSRIDIGRSLLSREKSLVNALGG